MQGARAAGIIEGEWCFVLFCYQGWDGGGVQCVAFKIKNGVLCRVASSELRLFAASRGEELES